MGTAFCWPNEESPDSAFAEIRFVAAVDNIRRQEIVKCLVRACSSLVLPVCTANCAFPAQIQMCLCRCWQTGRHVVSLTAPSTSAAAVQAQALGFQLLPSDGALPPAASSSAEAAAAAAAAAGTAAKGTAAPHGPSDLTFAADVARKLQEHSTG